MASCDTEILWVDKINFTHQKSICDLMDSHVRLLLFYFFLSRNELLGHNYLLKSKFRLFNYAEHAL